MAADALRVSVLFSAIDRLTGPIKGMTGSSSKLQAVISGTRKEIQSLERSQGRANAFRKAEGDYRRLGNELKVARLEAKAAKLALEAADKPTAALARAAERAAAAEGKAGRAYQDAGMKLQKLGSELENAGVDLTRLIDHEDALAMKVYEANKRLGEQKGKLEQLAKANATADKIKAVGDKVSRAGMAMSLGITLPALAFGKSAIDVASDANELESAFEQTFGRMSPAMKKWAVDTGNAMGRSTQEMQKGANTFGMFFNQVAPAEKAAAMSQKFAELSQDLGSFFNTDTQTAIDKLRSGLSGESEPLRDFGVFLNEAAVKAKLLKMGIKPVGKEFTDQQKILGRYQLILEATKKAQGDVARTSEGAANKQRAMTAQFEETQVAVGQQALPAMLKMYQAVSSLLGAFNNLSPATQGAIVKAVALLAVLGPVLIILGKVVTAIGAMRKAWLAFKAAQAASAAGGAASALSMGPLLIIVAIAAAIGVAAYLVWKHWDKIKAAFASAGAWIGAKLQQLGQIFMRFPMLFGPLGVVVALVVRHWAQIRGAFGGALAFLVGLPARFAQLGANIIQGLIRGVTGKLAALKATIVNAASSAANWFKSKLGIHSPSRVFMGFGGNITEGLSRGIAAGENSAVRRVDRLSSRVAGAFAASSLVASPAAASPLARPSSSAPASSSGTPAAAGRSSGAQLAPLGPITIQIVAAPGQSVDELARAVEARLRGLQAAAARSSYHDDA